MLPVATIIDKLLEAAIWQDGEGLLEIRARLTPAQLAAPGQLVLRVSERGALPWLLRARVEQDGELLFEVIEPLPANITHTDVEAIIADWQVRGYLLSVNVSVPNEGKE
jgi:hypothetical protein